MRSKLEKIRNALRALSTRDRAIVVGLWIAFLPVPGPLGTIVAVAYVRARS